MPNYCENKLTIKGDPTEVERFIAEIAGEERVLDFAKSVPMPPHIYQGALGEEERAKYGENNWYDWSVENWGTKWGAVGVSDWAAPEGSGIAEITFDTAWAPPVPWLVSTSKVYPELEFNLRYEEPGIVFAGDVKAKNGEYEDTPDTDYVGYGEEDEDEYED
jgi:hypothetical protein